MSRRFGFLLLLVAMVSLWGCARLEGPTTPPLRVAVFQEGPEYLEYAHSAIDALLESHQRVAAGLIDGAGVRRGDLRDVDVLIFPGGSGGAQCNALSPEGGEIVEQFVADGGGVIGICAGGYSLIRGENDRFCNVELMDADLLDGEHWARGIGNVMIQPADDDEEPIEILYYNGPLWKPADGAAVADYTVLAIFASDMHEGDAPTGVMPGTPAIIAAQRGEGRVVLFSPHPERTPGLGWMLVDAANWVAGTPDDEISWETVFRSAD